RRQPMGIRAVDREWRLGRGHHESHGKLHAPMMPPIKSFIAMTMAGACLSVASIVAAQPVTSESVPVPGGTAAMARALGITSAIDRPRFLAELVRVLYDPREASGASKTSALTTVTAYVSAIERLQSALAAVQPAGADLSLATTATRNQIALAAFLDLAGLKLREKNNTFSVERANDNRAADRIKLLSDIGVDAADLATQFNAGKTVHVAIASDTVPVPLNASLWSDAVLHRPVAPAALFAAIVSDRRAAMLAHGLASLDEETIRYLADNPAILSRVYEDCAASFAVFGDALRIRGGHVVPPG